MNWFKKFINYFKTKCTYCDIMLFVPKNTEELYCDYCEILHLEQISEENDYRDDRDKRGIVLECWYCDGYIRVDNDFADFDFEYSAPEINCSDCTGASAT